MPTEDGHPDGSRHPPASEPVPAQEAEETGFREADVTAVINCHQEGLLVAQAYRSARRAADRAAQAGLRTELLLVLDLPDDLTRDVAHDLAGPADRIIEIEAGNLSKARNAGVAAANGRTVAFLDADDLWGEEWILRGYDLLKHHEFENVVAHPEYSVLFGQQRLVWHHFGMDHPDFRLDYCMFDNYFTALSFAPKRIFERHPYPTISFRAGFGYEDWAWLCATIHGGVRHLVVPETLHAIRRRRESLLLDSRSKRLLMLPTPLFSERQVDWEEKIGKPFPTEREQLEEQRRLAGSEQARAAGLAAALEERTQEGAALAAELDRARILARLHSLADYLKLLAFWPFGWLLRQVARAARPRMPFLAEKLAALAELIDRRHYRAFAGILLRTPRRIVERARARPAPAAPIRPAAPAAESEVEAVVEVAAPRPVAPEMPVSATAYVETAPGGHEGPIVLVLGPAGPDALAATVESLRSQTLRPSEVREYAGRVDFPHGDGDLVCLVAAGARLDPTALELLAATLLSVPDCKFAAVPVAPGEASEAGDDTRMAACLIPGRLWRECRGPARASAGTAEGFLENLGSAMQGAAGWGLLLPRPSAASAGGPGIGFDRSAWPAIRAAPDRLWSASSLDGAERLESFLRRRPARSDDARPHLLVVVPWLPMGGSEIVLLEVLEHVAERWRISIVTTLPDDHAMRAAFARLTDEIYHAGDIFDSFRLQALVSGLITARNTGVVLSSNSGILYRMVPELKAAHPEVAFIDIVHNDLPTGHIRSAVEATTSLDRHVAVSRRVGEALVSRGVPRDRVAVIPNGVDTDLFNPRVKERSRARASLGVDGDGLLLAFVGRFSAEKRVGAFAEIVSRVREKVPVRAIVVGEGDEDTDLRERIAQEDLPVRIIPRLPRFGLVEVYAAADLLVLTSVIEGMPMVVLEAMATGCPVAVTDVGDVRRIVDPGVNGFVAPADRPEDLADAIVAAARDPGRLESMRACALAAVTANGMTKAAMLEGYGRLLGSVQKLERTGFDRAGAAL